METRTHIDKLRNPNYLGGWDLMDENGKTIDRIVTIKEIKNESVFNQKNQIEEQVITLLFEECKPIILNATNRKTLKKVTGTEYIEEMIGKKIQLTTKRIKAFGEFHDAIRITTTKPSDVIAKPVDVSDCLSKLEKCTTLAELQTQWTAFTAQEQNETKVLAEKDRLKSILK
jgi:DNA-binding NtrC family response regulator